jgi:hypothetical protein
MTVVEVNTEVTTFVNGAWIPHAVTKVQQTGNENVTNFSGQQAEIRYSTRGNLHHETGHVIIEDLWNRRRIEEYFKEGVCDAYKFLRMQKNGISTYVDQMDRDWFAKIGHFKVERVATIRKGSGDRAHDIIHAIPASRLLRCCDTLEKLSNRLTQGLSSVDFLDLDGDLPWVLNQCWDLLEQMKMVSTIDEKESLKKQIETLISSTFP